MSESGDLCDDAREKMAAAEFEVQRLRRLLAAIAKHPDTPLLFSGVIRNELGPA
jgi:hypothetical protein